LSGCRSHDEGDLRIVVAGASSAPICGVRDYARVTSEAMAEHGAQVTTLWWERDVSWGGRRTLAEVGRWLAAVDREVERERPDWIVWHYSVFTWGFRGIPVLAPRVARRLARTRVPVLAVLHELAFPLGEGGLREIGWALTQRASLVPVVRACSGAIVTTEERASWLRSRRWLPTRPVSFFPVCSNLPVVSPGHRLDGTSSVGVFGFAAEFSLVDVVVAALGRLRENGLVTRLALVGSPGAEGPAAEVWRKTAARLGLDQLVFTGVLESRALAQALASVDIVLVADRAGPMSRRTTLAAALALGTAVVAVDGPKRWKRLVDEQAVMLAPPTAEGLAAALEPLLRDEAARSRQGALGAQFYRSHMSRDVVADQTLAFIRELGNGRAVDDLHRMTPVESPW
jgi:glycosyltransferase involved in cell wall biosynthesis